MQPVLGALRCAGHRAEREPGLGADFALAAAADGAGFGEKPALLLRAAGASVRGALVETLAALVPELRVLQPPAELPETKIREASPPYFSIFSKTQATEAAAS